MFTPVARFRMDINTRKRLIERRTRSKFGYWSFPNPFFACFNTTKWKLQVKHKIISDYHIMTPIKCSCLKYFHSESTWVHIRFLVGSVLLIFSDFCIVLLCVFTFWVPYLTYRYIDDVLSINNSRFAEFLPLIYPPELEV